MKPEAVARAERLLGARAESWHRVVSRGWSLNEHWTLELDDGTRAFLKEAAIDPSPGWLRQEREVLGHVSGPFAPRLLGWEDGERPLLVLEDLTPGSHWPPPWRTGDVEAVLATLRELAETPAPSLEPFPEDWGCWSRVAAEPEPFLGLGVASAAWLERCLPVLLAAEERTTFAGEGIVHGDVRSDNLCLRDGRAVLLDWNFACRGDSAFDVAAWLPSLALEGGPPPQEVTRLVPEAAAFAVAIAGFFASLAGLPPPEGAPRVRGFQLAQLEVALPWACEVLDLAPPSR